MADDPLRPLAAQLRAPPPPGLACLRPEQLEDLANAVRDARRHQAAALAAAGEQALGHIPRLLRGPVRKFLG
jgi:hypothetical protein